MELRKRAYARLRELADQDSLRLVDVGSATAYGDSLKRAVANGDYHTEYYPAEDAKPRILVRTWVDRDAKVLLYSY